MISSTAIRTRTQRPPRGGAEPVVAPPRVGVLAGWGRYPIVVVEALKRQGCEVHCLGIKGHADPYLGQISDSFGWVGLAKLGAAVRWFRKSGVRNVTMAGKVHKTVLMQPRLWLTLLPDWRCVRRFWPHFVSAQRDRKDDTLLGAIIEEFALDGICFAPATDFAPELLVSAGQLTRLAPTPAQLKDIQFGWTLAKEMGRLDIGQSVAVKGQAVLAVEAIEGTDACIRRAGGLCKARDFTVVKVAKPQQDMRFDVPTIGVGTLHTMADAGARVLAVEAGRTIMLDQAEMIEYANRHRLVIVALDRAGNVTDG